MNRFLLVGAIMAGLALTACAESDGEDQATAEEQTTTTTIVNTGLQAWCLGWESPLPEFESPISAENLEVVYRAIQAQREAMLEVAPTEITETNQDVVDFGRELNEHLAENGWNPNTPPLDSRAEFEAAQQELQQFGENNC